MNTPDPDLRPSATVDEAVQRYTETANDAIADLLRQRADLIKQRDELASCLREAYDGFNNGRFTFPGILHDGNKAGFVMFVARCHAALLRCDVRTRLDDKLAAERRGQERAA